MLRLLRCKSAASKKTRSRPSPPGRSTRTTSAPKSARILVQVGPERTVVRSRTENRARGRPVLVTGRQSKGGPDRLQPPVRLIWRTFIPALRFDHALRSVSPPPMTILIAVAAVVFTVCVVVVQIVSDRRQRRRTQEQWEERERALDRKP